MLPANLINALQVLSGVPKTQNNSDTPTKTTTNFEPGQLLQGTVQAKISEGLFRVQVAGQVMQLHLPGNIRSGDVIRLQVISTHPRITFGMVASTNPLSTAEQIGATARMLAHLADQPLERRRFQQVSNKAVWQPTQNSPDTRVLASALHDTLGKSGLFYESHQAQWLRGERSILQLLEEPQNTLTGHESLMSDKAQLASAGRMPLPNSPENRSIGKIPAETIFGTPGNTSQETAENLLHLVQQQLHALEHHHLVWLGQVWPDQQMQWEIRGDPNNTAEQLGERQWSTEIELVLPKLGKVNANLQLTQGGLSLSIRATETNTVGLFTREFPTLRNALSEVEIELRVVKVEKS